MAIEQPRKSGDSPTRRKSSNTTLFANLHDAKRGPVNDRAAARRASLVDQSQQRGVFGNLWHSYVRPENK